MPPALARKATTSWMYEWSSGSKDQPSAEVVKPRDPKIEAIFKQFDTDGSGAIDLDELQAALSKGGKSLARAEAADLLARVDTNKDGKLQYDEFEEIFRLSPDQLPLGVKQIVDVGNLFMSGFQSAGAAAVDMWDWSAGRKSVKIVADAKQADSGTSKPKPKPSLSKQGTTSWMYNWGGQEQEEEKAEEVDIKPTPPQRAALSRSGTTSWMYNWNGQEATDGK